MDGKLDLHGWLNLFCWVRLVGVECRYTGRPIRLGKGNSSVNADSVTFALLVSWI